MDINTLVTVIATIVGIVISLFVLFFGQKSISDLLKDMRGKNKKTENKKSLSTDIPIQPILSEGETTRGIEQSKITKSFSDLVKTGQYKEAIEIAERERSELVASIHPENPDNELNIDDFDAWFARAQIYTGNSKEGLEKLNQLIERQEKQLDSDGKIDKPQRNMLLGRAHNDKGYANWMDLGHYEIALQEFSQALRFYNAGHEKTDEIATTCDNLGRVYAQLGFRARAGYLINRGREIRLELDKNDRYALSLISSAILNMLNGNPHESVNLANEAYSLYEGLGDEKKTYRGKGLSKITKGQALRQKGSLWRYARPSMRERFNQDLDNSLHELTDAQRIFEDIYEPIRICQIANEIGCVYREQIDLSEKDQQMINKAKNNFNKSLEIAKDKFPVLYVDGCEDLAQLYFKIGDTKNARDQLKKAEETIDRSSKFYRFKKSNRMPDLENQNCIEDFWQQLGKVYSLRGNMLFDEIITSRNPNKRMNEVFEYYILAAGYFGRFMERPMRITTEKDTSLTTHLFSSGRNSLLSQSTFMEQMYSRLQEQQINTEVVKKLLVQSIPKVKQDYGLSDIWVDEFFRDVTELLVQLKP